MKHTHRKRLLISGLCIVLALAIIGTLVISGPQPSTITTTDLTRLDKEAQVHFDNARAEIPSVIRRIRNDGIMKLGWLMTQDKVSSSHKTETYIHSVIEPILKHCRAGAAVYGIRINEDAAEQEMSEISKDHVVSAAYGLSGLIADAVFIKPLLTSARTVLGAIVSRMASAFAIGTTCAVADGPFPFGDMIALTVAGVGTVWSMADLVNASASLPRTLEASLNRIITDCRAACRQAVLP